MSQQVKPGLRTRVVLMSLCALATALAGCAFHRTSGSATAPTSTPVGRTVELALRGGVLTDTEGRPLYVNDQERGGSPRCVRECLDVWIPVVAPTSGAPAGPVPGLGVVHRSDNGLDQLTYLRQPLYEFHTDTSGRFVGDGMRDGFGDTEFTWSPVRISGPGNPTAGLSAEGGI
jgi:predicted lipoprotein with Yx(FWY)xxD motif